jgi:hypothetical protein
MAVTGERGRWWQRWGNDGNNDGTDTNESSTSTDSPDANDDDTATSGEQNAALIPLALMIWAWIVPLQIKQVFKAE